MPLLDDVPHRLRRGALHLPVWRSRQNANLFLREPLDPKLPTAIGGTVLVGDYLYGSGQTTLMCVEYKTGQIKWNERSGAPASL